MAVGTGRRVIGATPPAAIRDWRYFGIAILGATAVSFFYQWVQAIPDQLIITGIPARYS